MKPIEGLDLAALTEQAQKEYMDDLEIKTRRKIAMIISAGYVARGSITDLERQLVKARERLAKEQARLEAIKRGDWSILQDEKDKGEQQENGKPDNS